MVRIIVIEVVYNKFCMTTHLILVAQVWGISVCEIVGFVSASCIYSRRQYKVSVSCHLQTLMYFKKTSSKTVPFILLGVTQYYCFTRSEHRAELSFKWIFLLCLYRCCSSRLFLTRPFRSSLSIVSALLVD